MQWLIDIAKGAMKQYLIDNPRFVDRGDPAVIDFTLANFIQDNAWHDLDLSGIVPANARGVLLKLDITAGAVALRAEFRKNGNANNHNTSTTVTQVVALSQATDCVCYLDDNRIIEYRFTMGPWISINVTVRAWWL